jgi:hypothetical protein
MNRIRIRINCWIVVVVVVVVVVGLFSQLIDMQSIRYYTVTMFPVAILAQAVFAQGISAQANSAQYSNQVTTSSKCLLLGYCLVTMTFGPKLNWLVLVETMLAFAEAKRNQFWAGDFHVLVSSCLPPVDGKRDAGLAVLRGLESLLHNARKRCEVGWEDDFLKGTAAAYLLICDVVNACIPVTMNGIAATKALLRKWRDLTVIHCACLTGVSDEVSFMRVLDVAFGGLLQPLVQANRDLNSSLLQSYQKMLAHCDGASFR